MKSYNKVELARKMRPVSVTYSVSNATPVLHTPEAANGMTNLPKTITIIYVNNAGSKDGIPAITNKDCYLYIDSQPVPSDMWSYDSETCFLEFNSLTHKGHFHTTGNSDVNYGLISNDSGVFSVSIIIKPLKYVFDLAKDAAYAKSAGNQPVLVYDPSSTMWKDAWCDKKQEKKLNMTYKLASTPVVGQEVYDLTMKFESPDENIWKPAIGTYAATIDGNFNISYDLGIGTDPDRGYEFYPYKILGKLDPFGQVFTGAMLTGENSVKGSVYGIIGHYVDDSKINGTYQLEDSAGRISVLGGELYINGIKAENTYVNGTELSWNYLKDNNSAKFTNILPEKGTLYFSEDGSEITGCSWNNALANETGKPLGRRLSPDEVTANDPEFQAKINNQKANNHPSYNDFLNMSQYRTDEKGNLRDIIQERSMDGFMKLLKYSIPTDLYKQFINLNVDDLPADLRGIYAIKGDDGSSAETAYKPYTTAYLTSLLSGVKQDSYSGKLNAARANKHIREKLTANKVYQNQAPAIYRSEWIKEFPDIQKFIRDQDDYADYYTPMIGGDAVSWKEDAKKSFDETDADAKKALTDYQNHIDKIANDAIKNKKYWAYFLLRYTMTPTFLLVLQTASLGGTINPASEITKKVQQISALITVLDARKDSIFVQEFMQMISIFQLSNVIPILFDLSGDKPLADYSFAMEKILREFAKQYGNSADETLKNYAKYITSLSVEDFQKLYKCMVFAYNSLDGAFVYSKFVLNFDKAYQRFFGKIPEMVAYACIIGAVVSGIVMFASGKVSWKDLSTLDQLKLIGTGVGLFAVAAVKIVQRAMLVNMLNTEMGFWKRVGTFFWFSDANKIRAMSNPSLINSSIKKYFIGEMGLGKTSLKEVANSAKVLGHVEEAEASTLTKIIGKNLDVTLVRGFGTIFALAGIAMCIVSLCSDSDDLEIISDVLFIVSSCVELVAIGVGALGFETASAVLGPIGILIAAAGCILILIEIMRPRPSPIEEFAKKEANNLGMYMEHGYDIDTFEVIPASGTVPSQAGIALYSGSKDNSVIFNSGGTTSIGRFDGKAASCLGLDVDADGNVRFYTILKNNKQIDTPYYLTHDASGNIKVAEYIYESSDFSQIWTCSPNGTNQRDKDGHLKSAAFTIKSGGANQKYLNLSGSGLVLSDSCLTWTVEMEAAAASGLQMSDIILHQFDKDRIFVPHLDVQGSDPKTFSLSPALPDFMAFQSSTGAVSQKKSVTPKITAKKDYSLSLRDALGNILPSVKFSFEVCEATKI